jgi:hypothetical protein
MLRVALALSLLALTACAPQASDYTPQIEVQPGAAARSLWIGSKAPEEGGAKAEEAEDPEGGVVGEGGAVPVPRR